MSLPPERISIKRRRQEEPVELFYLENYHHENKRRFTDYCFQRARLDAEAPEQSQLPLQYTQGDSQRAASSHAASGLPVVRATSPGAEIRDEAERRVAQKALREHYLPGKETSERTVPESAGSKKALPRDMSLQQAKATKPARRFHLCRGQVNNYPSHPNYYSGIQKRKTARRDYLATFVERFKPAAPGPGLIDQIANQHQDNVLQDIRWKTYSGDLSMEDNRTPLRRRMAETGQSIHSHQSTWDHDSDQLAEELAAFAFRLSQNEKRDEHPIKNTGIHNQDMGDASTHPKEDWVYDTYVRIPIGMAKSDENPTDGVGLLVIDDEDQELWQRFGESNDESDWDEEDPDSNEDNPANDYPDEEINSEDEDGHAYTPRHPASDEEEYDLRDPWSDSEH